MKLPSDYNLGYEHARKVAPEMASHYVAHTHIGDPVAEAMVDDLAELGPSKSWRLIEAAMQDEGEDALRDAPSSMREFFEQADLHRSGSTIRRSVRRSACFTGTRE